MRFDANTRLAGVIGNPVRHSLSPIMYNTVFSALGLNCVYMAFEVEKENLEDAIRGIRGLGFMGINVTIPHKTGVIPFLDELSAEAEIIGAVNTIVNKNGKLIGYNTDSYGYEMALQEKVGISLKNRNVFVIGAGGAAHAIAGQSILSGASAVVITNRTFEKAKSLMDFLNGTFCRHHQNSGSDCDAKTRLETVPWGTDAWRNILHDMDIIVNTTSIGMNGRGDLAQDIPWNNIKKDAVFFDVVYTPIETSFLKEAIRLGHRAVSGLYMLIYQGAKAFELWTGKKPPIELMEKTLVAHFSEKGGKDA
ncbi:MAG TPA: shikimate dehydrogenase [Thermoanaerobacterales bacterium]|nr:shikimate dehydrogenase [Thermoanaerobacterales bacterium]